MEKKSALFENNIGVAIQRFKEEFEKQGKRFSKSGLRKYMYKRGYKETEDDKLFNHLCQKYHLL